MLAQSDDVVISVSDCHAVVSRYRQLPDGSVTCERAVNAEELEAEAVVAIVAQGGRFGSGEHCPCPAELAARAHWS